MDVREMVDAAVVRLIESEVIEKAIAESIEKTVTRAVEESLSGYSDFGKQITAAVKESLALRGDVDLPSYNETILALVRRQVESATKDSIEKQVADRLSDFLTPAPESIKLSELAEQFVERAQEKANGAGCVCYGDEAVTIRIRDHERGFWHVEFDEKAGRSSRECAIDLGVYNGKVYLLRFRDGGDVESKMFVGSKLYGFERMLFQMKAAGTEIVRDVEEHEIETGYLVGAD